MDIAVVNVEESEAAAYLPGPGSLLPKAKKPVVNALDHSKEIEENRINEEKEEREKLGDNLSELSFHSSLQVRKATLNIQCSLHKTLFDLAGWF